MLSIDEKIIAIENVIHQDVGRNISTLFQKTKGQLFKAVAELVFHPAPRIAIVSGFYVPDAQPPTVETDGLLGAFQLALVFHFVKIPVMLITDSLCAHALRILLQVLPKDVPLVVADSRGDSISDVQLFVDKFKATHMIAIERVGPAADGVVYNMRGKNINSCTTPLHLLFAGQKSYTTIGIGDGGNEIGMGKLDRADFTGIENGSKIACTVACDYLIACGVSNWGAFACAAVAGLFKNQLYPFWQLLEIFTQDLLLKRLVLDGPAVDGVSGKQEFSVDGLLWKEHARVMREIIKICS